MKKTLFPFYCLLHNSPPGNNCRNCKFVLFAVIAELFPGGYILTNSVGQYYCHWTVLLSEYNLAPFHMTKAVDTQSSTGYIDFYN